MAGNVSEVPASCFEKLPRLVEDLDVYLEAYHNYAEYSGVKVDIYKQWARETFNEQVVRHLAATVRPDEVLRVLAVGSGDGKIDSLMLEQLVAHFPQIKYTVVEPANEPLVEFKALVNEQDAKFDGVEFVWLNEPFDDFRAREVASGRDVEGRFHLAHAVHSLYYANDLREAESFLRATLVKGGVLMVILLSDEAGIYRVWDRYPKLVEGSPASNLCSAHLRKIYDDSATPYQFYRQSWPSDISPCFDPASDKGNGMLDFITHVRRFRQSAPEELRTDVLQFLSMLNRVDKQDALRTGGYQRDWDSIVYIKT